MPKVSREIALSSNALFRERLISGNAFGAVGYKSDSV